MGSWANTQSWSNLDKSIYSHARNHIYLHAYFMNLMVDGVSGIGIRIGQTKQTTSPDTSAHTHTRSYEGHRIQDMEPEDNGRNLF